jgi:hypothetical protein
MATTKQVRAAKRNVVKARAGAKEARSIAHLPADVRSDLGRQGARARARGNKPGHALQDPPAGRRSTRWRSGATSAAAREWASGS